MRTATILAMILPLMGLSQHVQVNSWQYIQIDDQKGKWGDESEPSWLRYFGLDMGDINQNRLQHPVRKTGKVQPPARNRERSRFCPGRIAISYSMIRYVLV